MRSLFRFLLGGALGAALGILLSQRRGRKPAMIPARTSFERAGAGGAMPVPTFPLSAVPEPEIPEPQMAEPEAAKVEAVAAIPEPVELAPEPVTIAPEPMQAPVVEAEPVVETPEPVVEAEPVAEAEPVVEIPEPVAEPEVAETVAAADEPEMAQPEPVEFDSLAVAFAAFDLKPEVEPEPMADTQEPAQADVFAESETEITLEHVFTAPEPEIVAFEPVELVAPAEPVIGEAAMFEPDLAELDSGLEIVMTPGLLDEPIPGSGWQSVLEPVAEEDMEQAFVIPMDKEISGLEEAEVAEEPPSNHAGLAAAISAAPGISASDLKARIEETRRRIRRELEEPFLSEDEMSAAPKAPEPEPEPALSALAPEAVSKDEFELQADTASAPAAAQADTAVIEEIELAPAEALTQPVARVDGPVPDDEVVAEYDAIKSRIEQTRTRLKAKAFDAMMTGESALLGREDSDYAPERPGAARLDAEIDQTIESTLREEDD